MKEITEGDVTLRVPDVKMPEEGEVFYNPHMALARDISVCIYSQLKGTLCDALAASGVRGMRLAKDLDVTLNDANPGAVELMKENLEMNGIEAEVTSLNANRLLSERCFDIVDIDPFGSPVPFFDSACRSAKKMIGICATDTAPLAGNYPLVCKRRYMATPLKNEHFKENAVRILCGYAVRNAAKYDLSLKPVFVHATRHYFRAYLSVERGAKKANRTLQSVGTLEIKKKSFGPMWLGPLWEKSMVKGAIKISEKREMAQLAELRRLLELIENEMEREPFYFDYHKICSEIGVSPPPMTEIVEKSNGARTHFLDTGIKTEFGKEEFAELIRKRALKG